MVPPARRRLVLCLAAAAALTALAAAAGRRLTVETDLLALLPEGSPAAAGYRVFLERFGGLEKVFVLVRPASGGSSTALLADGACRLADRLAASPEVAAARCGVEARDERFFLDEVVPRAPLWLDAAQVAARLDPAAIRRRVAYLRAALSHPGGTLAAPLFAADPLGFTDELLAGGWGPSPWPVDPLTGAFVAPAGDAALVLVTPAGGEMDVARGRRLAAALAAAFAELREEVRRQGAEPLEFRAAGGPLYAVADEAAVRADLTRTLAGSAVSCLALLALAFEGAALPALMLAAVGLALIWTAGWLAFAVGSVTAVSLGFAATLVGLGIDYGIHGAARYRQELAAAGPEQALAATYRGTAAGMLSSALTTAGAFAVLTRAHFRPLAELGHGVAAGILAMAAAAALLGPVLPALTRPGGRIARPGALWRAQGRAVEALASFAGSHSRAVLAVAAVAMGAAAAGLARVSLDPSLDAFRPTDHPAREVERLLAESFGLGVETATVVVSGRDLDEALSRAAAAEAVLIPSLPPGSQVASPGRWQQPPAVAAAAAAALARLPLAAAADRLERELAAAGLDPRGFAAGLGALRDLAAGRPPGPPAGERPDWLDELLHERDGASFAALRLRLPAGAWGDGPPASLRERLAVAAPGVSVASAGALGAELRGLARSDLVRLSAAAFAVVALIVVVSFRGRLRPSLLSLVPVLLGTAGATGLWGLLGRPLDLLCLAVVPILLGIGIDNGLHVLHGWRLHPAAGLAGAVRTSGRAMVLTSLTTCAGFGSLALSSIPGLANGGLLVATGVLLCLLTTLLVLPALAARWEGRGSEGAREGRP